MDLKLQFHRQMIQHAHSMLWYPEERVRSWMNYIFPMSNMEPARNYSLNRKQKKANLAWRSRRLASRWLVPPTLQVKLASRRLVRPPQAFLPSQASFYPQKTIPTTERKWFLRQRLASTCSSRMQQDEVLVLWEFQNSLASFRAIQGHSGGVTINPELTGTFWFLTTGRSISFTGVVLSAPNLSWWTDWFPVERKATKDGRLSSSHHWTFFGGDPEEEEPRDDYTVPQKVHCHSHLEDCNLGKQSRTRSSWTILCQQGASTE